jgi:hypothetical protein
MDINPTIDPQERFRAVKAKVEKLSGSKIRVDEKISAAKERVTKAIEASKAAGYPDPRKLGEIKKEKQEAFATQLEDLEKKATQQEAILSSIEA